MRGRGDTAIWGGREHGGMPYKKYITTKKINKILDGEIWVLRGIFYGCVPLHESLHTLMVYTSSLDTAIA